MSKVEIENLYCKCDNKYGLGELDIKRHAYTCMRCGKEIGDDE